MSNEDEPLGMVVGSFTSVSLKPPLVGFFPDKSSTTWPSIWKSGCFCVNVLGAHQQAVCASLAMKGGEKFENITFDVSSLGSPIIENALAWIDCKLDSVHEMGDHWLVVGRVCELALHADGEAMIFHKGGYKRVENS